MHITSYIPILMTRRVGAGRVTICERLEITGYSADAPNVR